MVFRIGALVALCAVVIGPQQSPPPQAPVFRSGVDLVALDVTVVDKDGRPVAGLAASDFIVTVNGRPAAVRALDYLAFGGPPGAEVAVPSRESTNRTAAGARASRGGRVIVILIDDLSARAGQGQGLLDGAQRILTTLDPGDLVGLATTSGLGPAINPTRDRAPVLAALKSKAVAGRNEDVTAPFYISVPEALDFSRGIKMAGSDGDFIGRECALADFGPGCPNMVAVAARRLAYETIHRSAMQLRAYTEIITALRAAPDPRVVIALSTGIAPGADGDYRQIDPVIRAAAEAGVQFYALTQVAGGADVADVDFRRAKARLQESGFLNAGVQVLAAAAGGEAFRVVGESDRFFTRIMSETSAMYRLGVEAAIATEKSRFLDVKVRVLRPGVTVRSNRHALLPSATAEPVAIDEVLRARIAQGGVAFGVPIALATALRRDPAAGGQLELGVNVQVPASVAGPLIAMYAIIGSTGQVVQAGKQAVPAGPAGDDYRLAFPLPLASGAYRLRFAVADALGNVGSVEHTVDATLPHLASGSVTVSDLFTTWEGPDGTRRFLALETLPDAATSLRAFLELYADDPGAPPAALSVRIALLRTGESRPILEQELTPIRDGALFTTAAEIPVDALTPGNYTIRAMVLKAGAVAGTVTTHVRKAG